jgi:hypothetical protein
LAGPRDPVFQSSIDLTAAPPLFKKQPRIFKELGVRRPSGVYECCAANFLNDSGDGSLSVALFFDGPLIRYFDGLPTSASRALQGVWEALRMADYRTTWALGSLCYSIVFSAIDIEREALPYSLLNRIRCRRLPLADAIMRVP